MISYQKHNKTKYCLVNAKKVKAKGGHKLYKFLLSEKERELKGCNDKKMK